MRKDRKTPAKLTLNRETIQLLSETSLTQAVAGGPSNAILSCGAGILTCIVPKMD